MPCSRSQHGLTRVGLETPTSGSGVRGINHQATALPIKTGENFTDRRTISDLNLSQEHTIRILVNKRISLFKQIL